MNPIAFSPALLTDPGQFAVGRLPAVSDHDVYANEREACEGCSSLSRLLDGRWQFHYAETLAGRPEGFEKPDYDCSGWGGITVPGHIQLQGYGKPQYVNTQYPWDGHEALRPPEIPARFNPVGSYVTAFTVPADWEGMRVVLVLHGVESACFVWVNGVPIGYAEDGFTPSRFDLTPALKDGENRLAIQVYRFCSGSWLEDQDFWRFSGIFRSVELRAEPRAHVEDLFVHALPEEDLRSATLSAEITLSLPREEPVTLLGTLLDAEGRTVDRFPLPTQPRIVFCRKITALRLWSAEQPNLYTLRFTLSAENGEPIEVAQTEVGFRRFEQKNGLLCLNGKRLLLHGVNRHEFSRRQGRALSEQDMLWDIRTLKSNNINAVRTSHYPNNSLWYRLCDRYGLYLIDETNLETHGTWMVMGKVLPENALPSNREEWQPACLDRAQSLLERDKNHACVLFWSCGNESYGGSVLHAMSQFFRTRDPDRPVHYEGIFHDRRYNDTSDVESQMYTTAANVADWLNTHDDKPFILCEYAHAMGNSVGGLKEYLALEDRYPRYQGGFIWDWIDQAIETTLPGGKHGLAYGGDFYDQPNDRNFCGDGLVFADRTPTPKLAEVSALYQDVHILPDTQGVTLQNRYLFADLAGYTLWWQLTRDGVAVADGLLNDVTVQPGESRHFPLPIPEMEPTGEYALQCELRLKADTLWAKAGYPQMRGQTVLRSAPAEAAPTVQPYTIVRGDVNLGAHDELFEALYSLAEHGLVSFGRVGAPLINFPPRPSLYRAPLDNDMGNHFPMDTALWQVFSQLSRANTVAVDTKNGQLTLHSRYELPSLTDAALEVTHTVLSANRIRFDSTIAAPRRTRRNLPELPALGLSFRLPRELANVRYYGLGPQENETDRCAGALLGIYQTTAEKNLTPYLKPQYCGNRTGVRWLELSDGAGRTLRISKVDESLMVSVLPYSQAELTSALHRQELPDPAYTWLDVAAARFGVGGDDTWGAPVLPAYRLKATETRKLSFVLEAL